MYNPKNIFKGILAGLFILLITICPATAADPVTQTAIVTVPQSIGISINQTTIHLNLTSQSNLLGIYQSETFSLKNTGNVNINTSIEVKDSFRLGSSVIDCRKYYISVGANDFPIVLRTSSIFARDISPGSAITPEFGIQDVPNTTPPGAYSTTLTYSAIAA